MAEDPLVPEHNVPMNPESVAEEPRYDRWGNAVVEDGAGGFKLAEPETALGPRDDPEPEPEGAAAASKPEVFERFEGDHNTAEVPVGRAEAAKTDQIGVATEGLLQDNRAAKDGEPVPVPTEEEVAASKSEPGDDEEETEPKVEAPPKPKPQTQTQTQAQTKSKPQPVAQMRTGAGSTATKKK